MELFITIVLALIVCFLLYLLIKKVQDYKDLKNLQDKELEERYKKEFQEKIHQWEGEIREKELRRNQIEREINEKQNFNNSLFKIREDELDRLIAEKKKEKEKILEKQLAIEEEKKIAELARELNEFISEQEEIRQNCLQSIELLKEELHEYSEKRAAINEAVRREKEIAEKEDFYRIVIPPEDQEDIDILNSIAPRLRNKEVLNRLIFEAFVRRPADEMMKRVLAGRDISGIYKITYLKTGEAYIGKTTNIKRRWYEHLKSALSIGTIAHTSFHDRLRQDGLWNYSFEVLEEVPKDDLTEREKFYIKLYGTDTQLNMKVG